MRKYISQAFSLGCFGLFVTGCGSSTAPTTKLAVYEQSAKQVNEVASNHLATANAALTHDECTTEMERYDTEVRPLLDKMHEAGGEMDACMASMNHGGSHGGLEEMRTACNAMKDELDRHMKAACASADTTVNSAENQRHFDEMKRLTSDAMGMADRMSSMMSSSMMSEGNCSHEGAERTERSDG